MINILHKRDFLSCLKIKSQLMYEFMNSDEDTEKKYRLLK